MQQEKPRYLKLADGRVGLRRFRDDSASGPRLVCFPYAGGQSLAFRGLEEHLPPHWELWGLDPPGHGWAPGVALDSVEALVDLYLNTLPRELLAGAVLYGHSLGGCVAFELARRLMLAGAAPRALVLGGTRPPGHLAEYESFLGLDDSALLATLIKIGGVPAEWANEPEVFDMFKDTLLADFRAFESFTIRAPLVGLPVLAIGGTQDDVCRTQHLFDWLRLTDNCRIEFVEGRHMFVQTNPLGVARLVIDFVDRLPPDRWASAR